MDTQMQRPEVPQAPEPAWGSTKASAQDDRAMDANHYHDPPPAQPESCGAVINPRGEHHTKKASLHKHA